MCAVVLCVLCFAANAVLGEKASKEAGQTSAQGELKLEGKYIKQLTLERREDRNRVDFDQPGEIIKLAAGQYLLREVHLEGGYDCYIYQTRNEDWITVDANKPGTLKAGAPLKQMVKAERQGRTLTLNYELLGIGGETYASPDRSKPPTFTVYQGDKKIASGTFEYG
jgi:hypothetical protein